MLTLTDKQISLLSWVAFGLALIALTLVVSNAFLETQVEFSVTQQRLSEPIPRRAAPPMDTATWKTYRNEQYGFELKYPADQLRRESTESSFPHSNYKEKTAGVELYHATPTGKTKQDTCYGEYSGIPYPCEPEVRDTRFGFFVVDRPYEMLLPSYEIVPVSLITIGGKSGIAVNIGVEGDGSFYYLAPITNDRTLMITRDYNNEFDREEQGDHDQALFSRILSTFKFIEPQVRQDIIYSGTSAYNGWTETQMKNHCSSLGGTLNPCGSVCLDPEEVCIQICAPRCEFK